MEIYEEQDNPFAPRVKIAKFIVIFFFLVLFVRLFFLQIIFGDYFLEKSENNRLRVVSIPAPRGQIFDRNKHVLVQNRPVFNLELVRGDAKDPTTSLKAAADILKLESDELLEKMKKFKSRRLHYQPQLVLKGLTRDQVAAIESKRYFLPGIQISTAPIRHYPYDNLAAHILGYVREISAEQIENNRYRSYKLGDLVGKQGLEYSQEVLLNGARGYKGIIVNADGQKIKESFFDPPTSGQSLDLTIDLNLQMISQEAMQGKKGVLVMLNANTGEVLSMVSKPDFDLNIFNQEIDATLWKSLTSSVEKKLHNRAVSGIYPPGSIFKTLMAIAFLAEGLIGPDEEIHCPGHFRVGNSRPFHCNKKSGHGNMNLEEALEQSCNVYFYTLGQKLGIDRIHEYATKFGLGQKTGIELTNEQVGLVPSRLWKKKYFRKKEDQKWYPGETPSVSIGQGALAVTPLQLARALSAVVNGGVLHNVKVLKGTEDRSQQLPINPYVLESVKQGLFAAVNAKKGTGKKAKLPEEYGIGVAGKTGTVQRKSSKFLQGKDEENHAWFAGYAPSDAPQVVVVAVVEGGGHGGVTAAPVVGEVLRGYFDYVGAKQS